MGTLSETQKYYKPSSGPRKRPCHLDLQALSESTGAPFDVKLMLQTAY